MKTRPTPSHVELVPVDKIRVINPRARDQKKFEEIIQSIAVLGLKKPITVSRRDTNEAVEDGYDLVCGEGRLTAVKNLGATHIPAIIVDVSREDRLVLSLVENIARRQGTALEYVCTVERLAKEGYSYPQISAKTNLSVGYIGQLLTLLRNGEERLLEAAWTKRIPLSIATKIAEAADGDIRNALMEAYENKELNHRSLRIARRLIELRKQGNKTLRPIGRAKTPTNSTKEVVAVYRREMTKRTSLIQKARFCEEKILLITTAFKKLLADDHFHTLLRAENLTDFPSQITNLQK